MTPLLVTMSATTTNSGERNLAKIGAEKAAEVLERYEPSEAAAGLVAEDMAPDAFLEALLSGDLLEDALSFLAYALPTREALWWCSGCVHEITPADPPAKITAAMAAADAWIEDPSDENRRAAMEAAEAATYETPAGCLALSVFFSEGSMSPPDCPPVPVGEWFSARTVAATLHLSALARGPEEIAKTARGFVDRGIDVANRPAPWEEAD